MRWCMRSRLIVYPSFIRFATVKAIEGLRLVSKWLPTAVMEPGNFEARGAILGRFLPGRYIIS
ncbi:MAG: hypothetical protein CM1200mP24_10460 [Gammaproteobacteria bacterium]|nr:MAG: hypothetical protein CM1200mP24_10460 [Gammaproteobacteria bacterium]